MKNPTARLLLSLFVFVPLLFGEDASKQVRQEFHQALPASGVHSVVMDNAFGNVKLLGWDRSEIQIDATKRGDNREAVDSASVDVQTHGDKVCIYTKYAQEQKSWLSWFGVRSGPCGSGQNIRANGKDLASVDYTISVPSSLRTTVNVYSGRLEIISVDGELDAQDINGDIMAQALKGPAKISCISGRVDASFKQLNGESRIHSINGDVTVRLAPEVHASLEARTSNGKITNEFGLNASDSSVGQRLKGPVGSGGASLEVQSVLGQIAIKKLVAAATIPAAPPKRIAKPQSQHGR